MPSRFLILAGVLLLPLVPAAAQAPGQQNGTLRVFLDCQRMRCDFSHLRREITFVDWVRDRTAADVHVLGTSEFTGAAGRQVTLTFIGLGRFVGRTDTLRFATAGTDTESEQRDALTQALTLGLVPFAARTRAAGRLRFSYDAPAAEDTVTTEAHDPWNFWVFRIEGGGSVSGQQRERRYSGNAEVGGRRVTEAWKLDLEVSGFYSRNEFVIDTTEIFTRTSWNAQGSSVWSVGPHFSIGVIAEVQQSTFRNLRLAVESGPGVEYSVFPYDESSRREITFRYLIGGAHYEYQDTTIFNLIEETRPLHDLNIRANFRQPWGNLEGGVEGRQFLHDLALHRIELNGGFNFRLVRGLSLGLHGFVARVKDQINLAASDLTPAEILVQQRQLGTDYEFSTSVSLRYTFGSLFNNVVNSRF